jgi:hypothetical protein
VSHAGEHHAACKMAWEVFDSSKQQDRWQQPLAATAACLMSQPFYPSNDLLFCQHRVPVKL